jgi:hypothetical protein
MDGRLFRHVYYLKNMTPSWIERAILYFTKEERYVSACVTVKYKAIIDRLYVYDVVHEHKETKPAAIASKIMTGYNEPWRN